MIKDVMEKERDKTTPLLSEGQEEMRQEKIGSPVFLKWWAERYKHPETQTARETLTHLLEWLHMPQDLTGTAEEAQDLLSYFHEDLAPDHAFWGQLAWIVQVAFPEEELALPGLLEQQVHQLRYVISMQQAQWIRENSGKENKTDEEALADWLAHRFPRKWWWPFPGYSLTESSRLHNKIALLDQGIQYPDGQAGSNLKVVVDFHTEFILSSEGTFLNELDPLATGIAGVVNGASFNYAQANDHRHQQLDVAPVRRHDPAFRKSILKNQGHPFRAPQWQPWSFVQQKGLQKEWSYQSRHSLYARDGLSNLEAVKQQAKRLKKKIRQAGRKTRREKATPGAPS